MLTKLQWQLLAKAIDQIMRRALVVQGVTLEKDGGYRLPNGSRGRYRLEALVYARAEKPCFVCGSLIKKMVQNGRSSYFCPNCQK